MTYTPQGTTYTLPMKRLQIYLDESLDETLTRRARHEGKSKAALIRDAVRERYGSTTDRDPFDAWAGGVDGVPGDIDSIVYGR